jgi:hypothetical protein
MRDGDGLERGALVHVEELGRGALVHVELGRGALVHVELGRGALVQVEEGDGALRRTLSPVKALRALEGTRAELGRKRASAADEKRARPKSEFVMRVPDKRVALGDGSARMAGTDGAGTRAADMAGPCGTPDAPMAAGRTPGAPAGRTDGFAGGRYGVG